MSLLMEALKQQQTGPVPINQPVVQSSGQGWKMLALLLLVLVGLLGGFMLASWWQQPAPQPVTVIAPPVPASAGQVLTELLRVPTSTELAAAGQSAAPDKDSAGVVDEVVAEAGADRQLVVSANAKARTAKASQLMEPQLQALESFDAQEPMAEASPDDEVVELPVSQPELSTADVSDELRNKFALALEQSSGLPKHQSVTEHAAPARDIQTLDEMLKRQIPPLRFEAHIFSSDPKQRWVKVNGKDLQEGQWVTADIQLKEITPQYVLLQTGRQMFSMAALTEWSYRLPTP